MIRPMNVTVAEVLPISLLAITLPLFLPAGETKNRNKGSVRNNLDNSSRKCAVDSVGFLFSKPQRSLLREDCENKKPTEGMVQLRIGKSKLFLTEPLVKLPTLSSIILRRM